MRKFLGTIRYGEGIHAVWRDPLEQSYELNDLTRPGSTTLITDDVRVTEQLQLGVAEPQRSDTVVVKYHEISVPIHRMTPRPETDLFVDQHGWPVYLPAGALSALHREALDTSEPDFGEVLIQPGAGSTPSFLLDVPADQVEAMYVVANSASLCTGYVLVPCNGRFVYLDTYPTRPRTTTIPSLSQDSVNVDTEYWRYLENNVWMFPLAPEEHDFQRSLFRYHDLQNTVHTLLYAMSELAEQYRAASGDASVQNGLYIQYQDQQTAHHRSQLLLDDFADSTATNRATWGSEFPWPRQFDPIRESGSRSAATHAMSAADIFTHWCESKTVNKRSIVAGPVSVSVPRLDYYHKYAALRDHIAREILSFREPKQVARVESILTRIKSMKQLRQTYA